MFSLEKTPGKPFCGLSVLKRKLIRKVCTDFFVGSFAITAFRVMVLN